MRPCYGAGRGGHDGPDGDRGREAAGGVAQFSREHIASLIGALGIIPDRDRLSGAELHRHGEGDQGVHLGLGLDPNIVDPEPGILPAQQGGPVHEAESETERGLTIEGGQRDALLGPRGLVPVLGDRRGDQVPGGPAIRAVVDLPVDAVASVAQPPEGERGPREPDGAHVLVHAGEVVAGVRAEPIGGGERAAEDAIGHRLGGRRVQVAAVRRYDARRLPRRGGDGEVDRNARADRITTTTRIDIVEQPGVGSVLHGTHVRRVQDEGRLGTFEILGEQWRLGGQGHRGEAAEVGKQLAHG